MKKILNVFTNHPIHVMRSTLSWQTNSPCDGGKIIRGGRFMDSFR